MPRHHHPDQQKPEQEHNERAVEADLDPRDAQQRERNHEIKKTPEEIHHRTGETPARRTRERTRERLAHQSAHEMRDGVAQERAGEEIGHEAEKDGEHHGNVSFLAVETAGLDL